MTFSAVNLPEEVIEENKMIVTGFTITPEGNKKIEGYINGPADIESLKKYMETNGLSLHFERDIETYYHEPEPEYFYEYENIEIKCKVCKNKFTLYELESDCIISEDGDKICSDTVCPICGSFNCCDIEYEKIEDALKRLNIE